MLKKTFITIHVLIALIPISLLAYHVHIWHTHNEIFLFPLMYFTDEFLNIDISLNDFLPSMKGFHAVYLYLIRLPLILWSFIISIGSYIKLYKLLR